VNIGALLGMGAGVLVWWLAGPTYESAVTLAVNQPRTSPTISVTSYQTMFESSSIAAQVIEDIGLEYRSAPMTPERFLRRVLSVEQLRGTSLIRIAVRLPDPQLSARVANDVADKAVQLGEALTQAEGSSRRDQLNTQQDEAAKNLRNADDEFLKFKQAAKVELLRTEVEAMVQQRQGLLAIEVELAGEKARSAAATSEQGTREPRLSLDRRIDQDPTVMEAARAQAGDARSLLGLGLKTEELNPTYLRLDSEVAMSRARIAQLERQRQTILDASKAADTAGKLAELYSVDLEIARLESARALARRVHDDISLRYEQARADVATGSAQLLITDPALPMVRPVSWSIWIWLALGAMAGAFGASSVLVTRAMAKTLAKTMLPD
jgi:uncharacterized protein involved in exopolysaccharide biosynthesis